MPTSSSTASSRLTFFSSPCRQSSNFHDRRLGQVGRLLAELSCDDAGADVGAADIDGENGVVASNIQARRQMRGADQAGFVGIVADRLQVDCDLVGLEDDAGAADRQLADTAGAEAAADHDALGVAPGLRLEEAADDERQLLREILDRALHDGRRLEVALGEQRIELLLADLVARLVAERVVARLRATACANSRGSARNALLLARSPMKPSSSFDSRL